MAVVRMRSVAALRRAAAGRTLSVSSCSQNSNDRYIQTTRVPTLHFQPSLPRLPIPKLQDSCTRYVDALRPVVSSEQLSRTQAIVADFSREGGDGEGLDKRLRQLDSENKHTSYISGPWSHMYLAARDPLVLNFNPFMAWKQDPRTTDQADRAANFIRAAVLFRNSLEDGQLEPDVFHLNPERSDTDLFRNIVRLVPSSLSWYVAYLWKAFPLDMSQYSHLFCSTRLPRQCCDELVAHPGHSHVVVMRNGHFYSLHAVQPDGVPVSGERLHSQLCWILQQPPSPPSHPLSYLSASGRDWWASVREELADVSEANRQALLTLDSALFVLCLDDAELTNETDTTHCMLHNYGANRWFDKSLNLIVTKNGLSAINFEHAWGDGVAVLRFFNELFTHTTTKPYIPKPGEVPALGEGVQQLEFQLTDSLRAAIEESRAEVQEKCGSLSLNAAQYDRYGSAFIKKSGLRADPLMQLAIQVAYYRQYGELVPSYESCSTAAFKHGRTETIRPATSAAKTCAQLMQRSHSAGSEEMMAAVSEAVNTHFELTRNAAMGQGFDRHLFALRTLAEAEGQSLDLFQDPTHQHMNHIVLSTSTLSADSVLIGGFAPVTPDGYGIGYNVSEDLIGCIVTTYPARDGAQFTASLHSTLDDLHCLMAGKNFK